MRKKNEAVHSKKSVRNFKCGNDIDKPVNTGYDGSCGAIRQNG